MSQTEFWDRIALRYSQRPISDERAYRRKLLVTRAYFKPDAEVLEFGCGTGTTAIKHAPYVQHLHAIDLSAKMIEIARGKATEQGVENVTFARSAIEDFSLPDESFDAVLGLSILHLLEDKEAAVAKVHRLLKPGGAFVTSTACLGDTMKFFKVIAPIGKLFGLMPLVKVFTSEELERSFVEAGFEIDYRWQPARGKAVFIVAKKVA